MSLDYSCQMWRNPKHHLISGSQLRLHLRSITRRPLNTCDAEPKSMISNFDVIRITWRTN